MKTSYLVGGFLGGLAVAGATLVAVSFPGFESTHSHQPVTVRPSASTTAGGNHTPDEGDTNTTATNPGTFEPYHFDVPGDASSGTYELCSMTLNNGVEVGTKSFPCANAQTRQGIQIVTEDGDWSKPIHNCDLGPVPCFTYKVTNRSITYTVYGM